MDRVNRPLLKKQDIATICTHLRVWHGYNGKFNRARNKLAIKKGMIATHISCKLSACNYISTELLFTANDSMISLGTPNTLSN